MQPSNPDPHAPDAEIATPDAETTPPPLPRRQVCAAGGLAGLLTAFVLLLYAPDVREGALWLIPSSTPSAAASPEALDGQARALAQSTRRLQTRLDARIPQGPYLIVSTTENRFRLMNRDRLTREGLCSTGSYVHLKGADDQEWLFHTPRGPFRIQRKVENPVWTKPDWAFVEEGLPVPPPGSPLRREHGVLGDYALALGDGYLLHGTLYQRLLGMPVTHGCVRLGDDDLSAIYHALRVGSPVFIY